MSSRKKQQKKKKCVVNHKSAIGEETEHWRGVRGEMPRQRDVSTARTTSSCSGVPENGNANGGQ